MNRGSEMQNNHYSGQEAIERQINIVLDLVLCTVFYIFTGNALQQCPFESPVIYSVDTLSGIA